MSRAVDPGWGTALRRAPMALIPTRGMRMTLTSSDGLTIMRMVWVTFALSMVLIGIVVVVLDATLPGGGIDGRVVAAAIVVIGVFLQLLSANFVPSIRGTTMPEVRAVAQRAFFIRVAFAEPVALLGFMGFVLTGNAAVYGAAFVVGLAGMYDAAPTTGWIARGQEQLRESGSDVELLDALVSGGITR